MKKLNRLLNKLQQEGIFSIIWGVIICSWFGGIARLIVLADCNLFFKILLFIGFVMVALYVIITTANKEEKD